MTAPDKPIRIQRKRTKGWRMHPNTIYVGRGTLFGNPAIIGGGVTAADAVDWYRKTLRTLEPGEAVVFDGTQFEWRQTVLKTLPRLRGKNLACWCPLCPRHAAGKPFDAPCPDCAPCHADVLLEIANR